MCGIIEGVAIAGAAIAAVGTGYSVYSQHQASKIQSAEIERRATSSALEAILDMSQQDQEKTDIEELGRAQRDDIRQQSRSVIAQGRSAYAAGNVLMGAGSQSVWEQDVKYATQLDIRQSRWNEDKERWAREYASADAFRVGQAGQILTQQRGQNLRRASRMDQGSTLLSGAGRVANIGMQYSISS